LRKDGDIEAWAPAAFGVIGVGRASDVELGSRGFDGVDGRDRINAIVAYAN
jgi:hypothetical protein